jgi:hypothetical protein
VTGAAPKEPRFVFMLVGLLITILSGPLIDELTEPGMNLWIQVAFTATLLVAVFSMVASRVWFIVGLLLTITAAGGTVIAGVTGSETAQFATVLALLAYCVIALIFTLEVLIRPGRITANQIIGAISVYLLAGVALSLINLVIYQLLPGSFKGLEKAPGVAVDGSSLFYYTFVTMTTLGYGDITPQRPLAEAVAYLTAIAGQFYIAILVAYLVGGYLSQGDSE